MWTAAIACVLFIVTPLVTTASTTARLPGEQVAKLWQPAAPEARLFILESAAPADTVVLYQRLAPIASPLAANAAKRIVLDIVPHALPSASVSLRVASRRPDAAAPLAVERSSTDIARELGLAESQLPAVLLTSADQQQIRAVWTAPFDITTTQTLLAALNDSTPHGTRGLPPLATPAIPLASASAADDIVTPADIPPTALSSKPLAGPTHDTPVCWLTLGTWAGPAGLSLWGLDYESQVSPNPGEPQIITYWDTSWHTRWQERFPAASSAADGDARDRVVIENQLLRDYAWSKGVAYAHLYLYSPDSANVTLHLSQTGSEISGWLNGCPLAWQRDAAATRTTEVKETDRNDQGGVVTVRRIRGDTAYAAPLRLDAGWNRLLVKLIMAQRKGDPFTFNARLSASSSDALTAIRTSTTDPAPSRISRTVASRYIPRVYTRAPFNLVHPGAPLVLDIDLSSADLLGQTVAPFLTQPVGQLELTVTDYDGQKLLVRTQPFTLPGRGTFDLGVAPAPGYYATQLRLLDANGNLVCACPPDGFNVIRGTAAQRERSSAKKVAVNYYFMAGQERYRTLFFPYMERIGILRNIGGNHARALDFYKEARARGLDVSADTWTHRDPDYLRAYVEETAPYVDTFKAFNEVDIQPAQRGTPAAWVAKAKQDYEIIKKAKPSALMLGASLVRPAADSWFEECLKLGLASYHDVWDVHCYPQNPPILGGSMSNSPNESDLGVLKVYKKLGLKNDKPFWIGETGARSGHGRDARRWQAAMIAKMTACALSREDYQRIGFLVPWRYSRGENRYYIMDIEAGHMPAEAAYYTASALIDGFDYKRIATGKRIQAARFGPTFMAWTTDTAHPISFKYRPEEKGPFVLVDVVGRVTDLLPDAIAPDGTLALMLTDSPIYLLPRADYERLTRF
ncbi:hypothetical protein OpiT1DRAFT_05384 [Opitutaceae bacterium TAV1]|nr:hypothetical protein OpiT1DRAFT_05384 [Opitutaceae bacterium TAV1]